MRSLYKIRFFRIKYIWNECLRVTVDHGEPAALNLDHHPMPFPEYMINLMQSDYKFLRLARNKGFRVRKTLSEFSPKHFHCHRKLIAA